MYEFVHIKYSNIDDLWSTCVNVFLLAFILLRRFLMHTYFALICSVDDLWRTLVDVVSRGCQLEQVHCGSQSLTLSAVCFWTFNACFSCILKLKCVTRSTLNKLLNQRKRFVAAAVWTDWEMEAGEGKKRLYRANLARRDQLMMRAQLALAANAHK